MDIPCPTCLGNMRKSDKHDRCFTCRRFDNRDVIKNPCPTPGCENLKSPAAEHCRTCSNQLQRKTGSRNTNPDQMSKSHRINNCIEQVKIKPVDIRRRPNCKVWWERICEEGREANFRRTIIDTMARSNYMHKRYVEEED